MNVNNRSKMLTMTACFTALISVSAYIVIPIGSVPLTMQSLMVQISALLLRPPYGVITIILYLFLGAIGLPVFSMGRGGFAHFFGPTGGYLIGFLVGNILLSYFRNFFIKTKSALFLGLSLHTLILLAIGHIFMLKFSGIDYQKAKIISLSLLLPSFIKICLGVIITKQLLNSRRFRF